MTGKEWIPSKALAGDLTLSRVASVPRPELPAQQGVAELRRLGRNSAHRTLPSASSAAPGVWKLVLLAQASVIYSIRGRSPEAFAPELGPLRQVLANRIPVKG